MIKMQKHRSWQGASDSEWREAYRREAAIQSLIEARPVSHVRADVVAKDRAYESANEPFDMRAKGSQMVYDLAAKRNFSLRFNCKNLARKWSSLRFSCNRHSSRVMGPRLIWASCNRSLKGRYAKALPTKSPREVNATFVLDPGRYWDWQRLDMDIAIRFPVWGAGNGLATYVDRVRSLVAHLVLRLAQGRKSSRFSAECGPLVHPMNWSEKDVMLHFLTGQGNDKIDFGKLILRDFGALKT